MAFRTWGRLLLTALGVSVLAGAGQLGVAYGFGIVRLTGAFTGTTVNQWPTQLVWVGWFAANAAVVGAVLTGRLARRDSPPPGTGRQLAIGGAAALGATVIAPLCMQPARAAELISVDPVWAVGICAVLGAVIGAGAAIAVLLRPELGWNMVAVAGAVWLLALISVLPSLGTTGPLPTVRLGVLEPSWLDDAAAQRLALLLLPIVALLAGGATAGLARWRGQAPLVSGATGVAGPVLVAFAYLTAGPGDAVDRYQATPYYASLIAILAGALGAAAAALLRWPAGARTTGPEAIEPSDILRPLPPGPELPGAASTDAPNEPAAAERTAVEPPTDTKPATVVPGPWAAEGSDGVRTVPAHWDWPTTTASGQHGPAPATAATPDALTKPASWLTDPTGEFTADTRTRGPIPEGVTSSADTERPTTTEASSPTDAAAGAAATSTASTSTAPTGAAATGAAATSAATTGATATSAKGGLPGAAAPAAGPADSEPSDSSTPRTEGRPTDDRGVGTTSVGTASAGTTGGAGAVDKGTTGGAGAVDKGTTGAAGAVDKGTTGALSTGMASTGAASTGAGDAAAPLKPRRTRKPKVSPEATPDSPGALSRTESRDTDETTTGHTRKVTRPGKSADRTGSGTPADTPVRSDASGGTASDPEAKASPTRATAANPTVAPGITEAPAAPGAEAETANPPRTTAASTKGAADIRTAAADRKAATTKPQPAASPTSKVADPKAGPSRTPVGATTDPTAPPPAATTATPATAAASSSASPADPASASAAELTGDAADARMATEDRSTAGLFGIPAAGNSDTDRWTPARSPWPVTSAWTVPPQAPGQESTASDAPTGPEAATDQMPRPRHRAPLPDLSRASTWNAFDTTRRTRSAESPDRSSPADSSGPSSPSENPRAVEFPVAPARAGSAADTDDPAGGDATPTTGKVAEQPSRRGRLGGLFRRNRSRSEEHQDPEGATEPLPAQDEEFVDWVAGLSKPVSDNEPEQGNARRSLRSTGRHHRE
ncbi:hypothetical protein [Micromonospora sp. WMMC250]|uniref:hypothetical protein n=1 Tax=Micromonospora sp. WMMC250 TaxID=3014781 RepID=UPI0022B636F5|nr:hypothetical protein [Micromonospora sp. WMMC250]MCZ7378382.1 hypothetical protein [Micromonospora sp. WMMC250]